MKCTAEDVAKALYTLFREWPEMRREELPPKWDAAMELPASALLLAVTRANDLTAFLSADVSARQHAAAFLLDFMAKLIGPLACETFDVPDGLGGSALARHVVEREILESHPELRAQH